MTFHSIVREWCRTYKPMLDSVTNGNRQEYLTLEPKEKALEDEKILEAAKHFGIDLTQILAMASVTLAGCRADTN